MKRLFQARGVPAGKHGGRQWRWLQAACICITLFFPMLAIGQFDQLKADIQALTDEREILTRELEQLQTTMRLLGKAGTRLEQSEDPVIQRLAAEIIELKKRVIVITEREVALLQELISVARQADQVAAAGQSGGSSRARGVADGYSIAREAEQVRRLQELLESYYAEMEEAALVTPTEQELAQRVAALNNAKESLVVPFDVNTVYLDGNQGSTVLAQITQRLADPEIPESRRDMAPICGIKTRLYGALIGSEIRSLRPVGKNHFVARVRLQPGETSIRIKERTWELKLREDTSGREYLITLFTPPGETPELHVFAITELLAAKDPHIPAWLPDELKVASIAE